MGKLVRDGIPQGPGPDPGGPGPDPGDPDPGGPGPGGPPPWEDCTDCIVAIGPPSPVQGGGTKSAGSAGGVGGIGADSGIGGWRPGTVIVAWDRI